MRKIFCSIFLATSFIANAQTLNTVTLVCSGLRFEKQEIFDLIINTDSGDMWQFPGYIALGCVSNHEKRFAKHSIDANNVKKECFDGWGYRSDMTLSRNTGNLTVNTFFTSKVSNNDSDKKLRNYSFTYSCKKITDKLF